LLQNSALETARALGADLGSIWRVSDDHRGGGAAAAFDAMPRVVDAAVTIPLALHAALRAICESGAALYSSDSAHDRRLDCPLLRFLPHRSVLIQPFRLGGRVAGMFVFIWTRGRHRVTPSELQLVDTISRQAAMTLEHAAIVADVRARRDILERRLRSRTGRLKHAYEELRASREELRTLAAHTERVREQERARIASEIHDELGQALTFLKLELAQAATNDHNRRFPQLVDDIIVSVRRIASELRPQMLDDLGLAPALEWQARNFEARTHVKCRFRSLGAGCSIDPDRSTALFRIFIEILTNIARHADATRVQISLSCQRTALRLDVRDNGKGMPSAPIARDRQFGLLGMQERAAAFGGRVEIGGAPRRGTLVRVRIPLPPPRPAR
jgi:signal transduction histidine kinase